MRPSLVINMALTHVGMESVHLHHGEVTADIRVEDKEGSRIAAEDLVSEVVDAPGRTQRGILLQIPTAQSHNTW